MLPNMTSDRTAADVGSWEPTRTSQISLGIRYRAVLEVVVEHGPLPVADVDDYLPAVSYPPTHTLVMPELVRQRLVDVRPGHSVEATEIGRAVVAGEDVEIPPSRMEVVRQVDRAVSGLGAVGMGLGHWAGRGDWAHTKLESQDAAGVRALADLDASLDKLRAARELLASAVRSADQPRQIIGTS